jgi:hypothetical protein
VIESLSFGSGENREIGIEANLQGAIEDLAALLRRPVSTLGRLFGTGLGKSRGTEREEEDRKQGQAVVPTPRSFKSTGDVWRNWGLKQGGSPACS